MKFVEESEGSFSAAQLAAAERELEQQKKEWELDRLRALREEEERRMRLADDDEKPLTFGREDAQNQVNNTSTSKKLVNKKTPPSRRSARRGSQGARESSESETETTTSESESQEDQVEDSPDEESSHTESQSQEDDDEEGEGEEEGEGGGRQNESKSSGSSRSKNRSNRSTDKSSWDLNSPRTRSRGNVKINLWTLDVRPILPGVKPVNSSGSGRSRKRGRPKADKIFMPPPPPDPGTKKSGGVITANAFQRRPDTPLPNASKKDIVNAEFRSQNKRFGTNASTTQHLKLTGSNEVLRTRGGPATTNSRVKFSGKGGDSAGGEKNTVKPLPVESTLIFNIKSEMAFNDTEEIFAKNDVNEKSLTDELSTDLNATVQLDKVRSTSLSKTDSGVDDTGILESDHKSDCAEFREPEKFELVTQEDESKFPDGPPNDILTNSTAEEIDNQFAGDSEFISPKSPPSLSREFEGDSGIESRDATNFNDNVNSGSSEPNNSIEKFNCDSDSDTTESAKSKSRNSRQTANSKNFRIPSPLPATRSKRGFQAEQLDAGEISQSKNKVNINSSFQSPRTDSPTPITRSAVKTNSDSNTLEECESSDGKNRSKITDLTSKINKFLSLPVEKLDINSTPKSKTTVTDTPIPGVTTRNKSSIVNMNSIQQEIVSTDSNSPRPGTPPSVNDTRRVTRSGAVQLNNSHPNIAMPPIKNGSKIRRIQRPDTPFPVSDFGRVTRSGIARPVTPMPQKSRRPILIIPLESCKPPNTIGSDLEQGNKNSSKFPKRSSSLQKIEGEFQSPAECSRKIRSYSPGKSSTDTNAMPSPLSTRSMRRFQQIVKTEENFNTPKRRPDTPLPNCPVRSLRVTRSTASLDGLPRSSNHIFPRLSRGRFAKKLGSSVPDGTNSLALNDKLDSVLFTGEITDTGLNSEPSSSTQTNSRDSSPKLRNKIGKKSGPKMFSEDSKTPNTDSNANAVDPTIKTQNSKSEIDNNSECQTSGKSVKNTVRPDSTTKTLENEVSKCLSDERENAAGIKAEKMEYFLPSVPGSNTVKEISQPTEIGVSNNLTALSIKYRAQKILAKSKYKLSLKSGNNLSISNEARQSAEEIVVSNLNEGNLTADENSHSNIDQPAVSQKLNSHNSNSHIPRAFVRISKMEMVRSGNGSRVSITSSSQESSESNSRTNSEQSDRVDTPTVDSSSIDLFATSPTREDNADHLDPEINERQSLVPADSTVLTYIDMDTETEYKPPIKKYRRKKKANAYRAA